MNLNLQDAIPRSSLSAEPLGSAPTLYEQIVGSASILAENEDTKPIGYPALIPEPGQDQFPGSYQVWYPVEDGYIYVDADGKILRAEALPEYWLMREEGI